MLTARLFGVVASQTIIGWAGVGAELLIALAIYWELEENRHTSFLSEAFSDRIYDARLTLFQAFFGVAADSLQQRSERFCQELWHNRELRKQCDIQLASLNKLSYFFRRKTRRRTRDPMLEWFPHSAILLWVILGPYILERQRKAGRWWARPYLKFVVECIQFALNQSTPALEMYDPDGRQTPMRITADELRVMLPQLRALTD